VEEEEPAPQFKAQPMPDYAALAGRGIGHVKSKPPTVPMSPNISVSNRSSSAAWQEEEEPAPQFKARPLPSGAATGLGSGAQRRQLTVPEPFALPGEALSLARKASADAQRAREALLEAEEKAKRGFRAQRVPNWDATKFVPKHSSKKLTEFDEFELSGEGAQHRVAPDSEENSRAEAFHAKPLPNTTYAPGFVPKPAARPPLQPCENTPGRAGEARAAERKAWEAANRERLAAEAKAREELVAAREADFEAQLQHKLQTPLKDGGLKFVARPVPDTAEGPDFVPRPSSAPLTEPKSPNVLKRTTRSSTQGLGGLGGGAQRIVAK